MSKHTQMIDQEQLATIHGGRHAAQASGVRDRVTAAIAEARASVEKHRGTVTRAKTDALALASQHKQGALALANDQLASVTGGYKKPPVIPRIWSRFF